MNNLKIKLTQGISSFSDHSIVLLEHNNSLQIVNMVNSKINTDHVGIVLRNAKNELFVYESTSTEGVGLTPWKHMIKYEWYKTCEKIAWRRLRM